MNSSKNFLLIITLIFIDQLLKFFIIKFWPFLAINNKGVAFGFFTSEAWIAINLVILILLIKFLSPGLPKNLIIAGGITNHLDRIFRGEVVDFINLKIWPVFNLADLFIVFGVILLSLQFFRQKAPIHLRGVN